MDLNISALFPNYYGINETGETFDTEKKTFSYTAGFFCSVLFLGVAFYETLKKFHFPYTVMLFIYGAILGLLSERDIAGQFLNEDHVQFFQTFTYLANYGFVIQLFLPLIIFEFACEINPHTFIKAIYQCIILAVPGFVLCAGAMALFARVVLTSYKWDWLVCIFFGTVLTATDPTAITEILKDYSVAQNIIATMEGEAMLNSGVALLVAKIILADLIGYDWNAEGIILYVIQNCLGAVVFGYVVAAVIITILRATNNDHDMEMTLSLSTSYILYFVSEAYLDISGILSVVVFGVLLSAHKSSTKYVEGETTVHLFWQTLSFWANSLIFTIVGVIVVRHGYKSFKSSDIAFIIASYFMTCVCRGCMMVLLSPLLKSFGYGFTWESGTIFAWGGTRGAIGLAIALLTRYSKRLEIFSKLMIQVSGVIVMTLIFNATTIHFLLKFLARPLHKKMETMAHTVTLLREAVQTSENVARMDKFLVGADWAWVHKVTQIKNPYEKKGSGFSALMKRAFERFRGHCKKCDAEIRIEPTQSEREEMELESRLLVLRALRTSVSNQYESYGILRRSVGHLNTSIENAINSPEKHLLAEDVEKRFLKIGFHIKFLEKHVRKLDVGNKKIKEIIFVEEHDATAFRKKCIKVYLSQRFHRIKNFASLINIVPIVGEYLYLATKYELYTKNTYMETEIIVFEAINGILALFYIFEAVIKIVALRCKHYFQSNWNVIDFIVTVTAAAQMIYSIVFISAFRNSFQQEQLYVLVGLTSVRMLRLFMIALRGILTSMFNQFCSEFYNAFDLAMGFLVANDEVAKSVHKIIGYEEHAENAQFALEKNMYEMICYVHELEEGHPAVVCAWRTYRAALYILRNMKGFINEMVNVYMIDETVAEHLLEEIELKMNATLSELRYMKADEGIRNTLKNVIWITNNEMLEEIMEKHTMKSYKRNTLIQDIGEMPTEMKILHKGIVKISGINTGEKDITLPNTDIMNYFYVKGNFIYYTDSPETFGMLGYLLQKPSITRIDSSHDTEMISISYEKVSQIEERFNSLFFQMYRHVSLQIAFAVLRDEQEYEKWSDEKLKIHLEEGIFPNLEGKDEFDAHSAIADMVLIQGKVIDRETDAIYIGPAYIPDSVRALLIPDDPVTRPRVVMVLLRAWKYHARSVMDWVEVDEIGHIGLCLVHGMRRLSSLQIELERRASEDPADV